MGEGGDEGLEEVGVVSAAGLEEEFARCCALGKMLVVLLLIVCGVDVPRPPWW